MIPDFQTLMRPVLALLADGTVRRSRDVKDAMAEEFGLSEAERTELLPSGRQRTIDNRVGWSLTYLSQAGLVARPNRGQVVITDDGRAALAANPTRVDMKTLEAYPAYLDFRDRTREKSAATATPAEVEAIEATPSDLVEQALSTNRAAVEGEVLQAALALSPTGFEDLVIRLLDMCRRSGTPRTAPSIVRRSTSSPAPCSENKATEAFSSQRHGSPVEPSKRPSGSTRGSS